MAHGLRIRDSSGFTRLEITGSITKILGSFDISSDGNLTLAEFGMGTPFFLTNFLVGDSGYALSPRIFFSGATLFWQYPTIPSGFSRRPLNVIVGVR